MQVKQGHKTVTVTPAGEDSAYRNLDGLSAIPFLGDCRPGQYGSARSIDRDRLYNR